MKCFECPAQREITDPATNPLCKAGVRPWMLKCQETGCRYSAEQVNRWLKKKAPKSNADVLLEWWAKDTEAMADRMIGYDESLGLFYTTDIDGNRIEHYKRVSQAHAGQVAYLNSAAEAGK